MLVILLFSKSLQESEDIKKLIFIIQSYKNIGDKFLSCIITHTMINLSGVDKFPRYGVVSKPAFVIRL